MRPSARFASPISELRDTSRWMSRSRARARSRASIGFITPMLWPSTSSSVALPPRVTHSWPSTSSSVALPPRVRPWPSTSSSVARWVHLWPSTSSSVALPPRVRPWPSTSSSVALPLGPLVAFDVVLGGPAAAGETVALDVVLGGPLGPLVAFDVVLGSPWILVGRHSFRPSGPGLRRPPPPVLRRMHPGARWVKGCCDRLPVVCATGATRPGVRPAGPAGPGRPRR